MINGKVVHARSAVNISEKEGIKYGSNEQIYKVDTGEKIIHKFEDGAIVLSKKLLDTIKG